MLFLILPPVVYFAAAMASKLDIGIRHVLPIMPFLIVLAAAGAVSLARHSRGWAWAVSVLLLLHIASSLHAYPNYLPYSNEFFGGPTGTHRVLADSNVGWGGGLKALHASLERRHVTDCWFAYSAFPDPAQFQIPCKPLPTFFSTLSGKPQPPVSAQIQGPVFVSSEEMVGSFWGPPDMNPYLDFSAIQPSRVIGGEILEFEGSFAVKRIAATSEFAAASTLLPGQPKEALAHAKQAVALDPGSLYAHETLSAAYAMNRQPEEAMREYQTALQLYKAVDPAYVQDVLFPPVNPLVPQPH
jgi:tetratricopeptide (TPR) repeat protein